MRHKALTVTCFCPLFVDEETEVEGTAVTCLGCITCSKEPKAQRAGSLHVREARWFQAVCNSEQPPNNGMSGFGEKRWAAEGQPATFMLLGPSWG